MQARASYYIWMFGGDVLVVARESGPGAGVPIRHLRSSHCRSVTVVQILHHRQHPITDFSTVVEPIHYRQPAPNRQ